MKQSNTHGEYQWGKQTHYGPAKGEFIINKSFINPLINELVKERRC